MDRIELNINGKRILLYGSKAVMEKEKSIIENLNLTGNENSDRLIIQKCIDDNKLKSDILYDGNTVYPFEKIVKAYRKMQKSDSLENLTNEMYHFFTNACGDIAHYDIQGFRSYYNYSLRRLEDEVLKNSFTTSWHTDVDKIFKELKIGREYFNERHFVDIDKVPLNKVKSIIKECGWNIKEADMYWNLSKNIGEKTNYSFDLDILTRNTSDIVRNINYIANSFNKDSYCEMVYEEKDKNNRPSMSEIVSSSNNIKYSLNQLASDVLYKTRVVAEEKISILNQENIKNNDDFEYEY